MWSKATLPSSIASVAGLELLDHLAPDRRRLVVGDPVADVELRDRPQKRADVELVHARGARDEVGGRIEVGAGVLGEGEVSGVELVRLVGSHRRRDEWAGSRPERGCRPELLGQVDERVPERAAASSAAVVTR